MQQASPRILYQEELLLEITRSAPSLNIIQPYKTGVFLFVFELSSADCSASHRFFRDKSADPGRHPASKIEKPECPKLGLNMGHQQFTPYADGPRSAEKFFSYSEENLP